GDQAGGGGGVGHPVVGGGQGHAGRSQRQPEGQQQPAHRVAGAAACAPTPGAKAVGFRTTSSGRPVWRSSWSSQTSTTRPTKLSIHSPHASQVGRQRIQEPRVTAVTARVLAACSDGGGPAGCTIPSCSIATRSSRVAQCSASLPSATRNQWVWWAENRLPVGGTTPVSGPGL